MIVNLKKYLYFIVLFCSFSQVGVIAAGRKKSDAHSLQETYAHVADKAYPAVVVVLNCQYNSMGRLVEAGTGSGFFVRNDGVLVTNHHVIEGARGLGVRMLDGKLMPATVIGTSKAADIAVLKVEVSRKVPYLRFADTSKVKVGHYAIAIGAPLSLSHTMTTGVVSFKGRKLGVNNNEDFIQTDASINPGNSGGPLLNIDGQVIGVNTCGIMPGGTGSIGLNFAIDAKLVQRILGGILNRGFRERPRLGMTVEEIIGGKGVKVTAVTRGGAAESAGLRVGDIITSIDQYAVQDIFQFQAFVLTNFSSGDTTAMDVLRHGQKKTLKLTFK